MLQKRIFDLNNIFLNPDFEVRLFNMPQKRKDIEQLHVF